MRIYHLRGTQFAIPTWYCIAYKPEFIKWKFIFDERSWYDHNDPLGEQKDWLKMAGYSFGINAKHNSAMGAWRADVETQTFQFAPYFHDNKDTFKYDPVFSLPRVGGEVELGIGIDWDEKKYSVFFPNSCTNRKFTHDRVWARTISPWAGGTLMMPKTISFEKILLK